ncbi:Non-cyanogenic beta-glucosidase [Cinnamomum micranthum f. kanehirae]|uniref:Non-cyanogenic beta-glucosidase n=1 Tax=Cinnamomum micranthum f. kanehirae TaxID=337451 RepID=A0A3S3PTT4_9MAGN|nr:Non-cyanogenic beta-glucosidase [Cinnamomum micranthum f. kanehirae]
MLLVSLLFYIFIGRRNFNAKVVLQIAMAFRIAGSLLLLGRLFLLLAFLSPAPPDQAPDSHDHLNRASFPPGFLFGTSSSAYQFEGAAATGGKGPSVWDTFTHRHPGMEPLVTLFHWDAPQSLEDEYGGFLSSNIVKDFRDYANICFREFGDRVKHWITMNEPFRFSLGGYGEGNLAPGRCSSWEPGNCSAGNSATEPYIVGHNMLLAHAAAVSQRGIIGISMLSRWFVPLDKSKANHDAAQRAIDFMFMDPLNRGDYPTTMRSLVGQRLPKFTKEQSSMVNGSFDFIGLNYYTANYAVNNPHSDELHKSPSTDSHITLTGKRNGIAIGPQAASPWLYIYPRGIRDILLYIKNRYNNPVIYITENGMDEFNNETLPLQEALQDNMRIDYMHKHLSFIRTAIKDGVDVRGYFAWSFLDDFEWADGYTVRFGLNYVDFKDGLKRYPKSSAIWFQKFLQKDAVDVRGYFARSFLDNFEWADGYTDRFDLNYVDFKDGSLLLLGRLFLLLVFLSPAPPDQAPESHDHLNRASFPPGFLFGTSSSAYQYEGAAATGGKGPSVWDTFTHRHPEKIIDRSNGDVAEDTYHRYKEDVSIMKKMGLDAYRFSFSWSRILPCVEPLVTLFHWDAPQSLEDEYGGFLSSHIVKDFRDYANICFREFGDRVKHWITMNEPLRFSFGGYEDGSLAPGRCSSWEPGNCSVGNSATEPYVVGHNLLLAHAAAVSQRGIIGISMLSKWLIPLDKSKANNDAAQRAIDFTFMDPLYRGDYPTSMRSLVGQRLPKFTKEQSRMVNGSFDFIGLNYYTANYAVNNPHSDELHKSPSTDSHVTLTGKRNGIAIGPQAASPWIYIYPRGIRDFLLYMKNRYNNPVIYITENGMDEFNNETLPLQEALQDDKRIDYMHSHLSFIRTAIRDGVDVRGYFAWSFLDNFEWVDGYTVRFGLNYVDFKDGLKRYPKNSAIWFQKFLQK